MSDGDTGGCVFVISLQDAEIRRRRIEQLMGNHNLDYVFVDAVDGRRGLAQTVVKETLPESGNLYAAEVGCALSHVKAWRKIANSDSNNFSLVLEDDIHLSKTFGRVWKSFSLSDAPLGIYRFETMLASVTMGRQPGWSGPGFKFYPMHSPHGGTAAYALRPETAAELLTSVVHLREAIDIELFHYSRSTLKFSPVFQAYPALCIQDMFLPKKSRSPALGSQILIRRDSDIGFSSKFASRELLKIVGRPILNALVSARLRRLHQFRRIVEFIDPLP